MAGKRKVHAAAFKAQVTWPPVKKDRTVNELVGHIAVHPTRILLPGHDGGEGLRSESKGIVDFWSSQ